MPNKMLLFGITVLAVVIIIGGLSWTLFNNYNQSLPPQNSPTNGASPEPENPNPESTPSDNPESSDNSTTTPLEDVTETPDTPTPSDVAPEAQIRDATMSYVKGKHPEIAPLMVNLTWTGGRSDSGSPDNETYLYYSSEWYVTVEYPLTSEPTYTIKGNCNSPSMFITFTAVYKNGVTNITNYSAQRLQPSV